MKNADYLPLYRGTGFRYARNQLTDFKTLCKRIHAWKVSSDKILIHHSDRKTPSHVLLGKATPLYHADPKGLKVSRCNQLKPSTGTR